MQPLLLFETAAMLVLPVIAQTSVTQVFIPFADQQPLEASLIGQNNDIATLVVQCAPGTSPEDCGFPLPITVTAGPSTFHFSGFGTYTILGEIDCKIIGSTQANCIATQGIFDTKSIATATDSDWTTNPITATFTTSGTISGSEVTFIPVTITAGLEQRSSTPTSTISAPTVGTKTSSGSASTSTTGSSRATAAATTTNDAGKLSIQLSNFGTLSIWLALLYV